MKKKIIIITVILLLCLATVLLILSYTGPADYYLKQHFQTYHSDYETIVAMMQKDDNVSAVWHDDKTVYYKDREGDKIDANRINEYQALLKKTDIKGVVYYDDYLNIETPNIKFIHYQTGDFFDGKEKGIVFTLDASGLSTKIVLDSKTQYFVLPGSNHQATCSIEENWYIYQDVFND